MPPKFATSGLRGLVAELSPALVADHVRAFARACPMGSGIYLGRDLRASSPAIAAVVGQAARGAGLAVTDCGEIPTPALALAAMTAGAAAIMVTGSHIPDDRNGLKFYTPEGEITKAEEAAITAALGGAETSAPGPQIRQHPGAGAGYVARYLGAYGSGALAGMPLGVYSHSTVGRDLLIQILRSLGAEVTELGRAERFVPVDTEAVEPGTRAALRRWAAAGGFAAILSMDGDGDRPLMTDETGEIIPGDVLGQITAAALGAEVVVTPVSSNTGAEASGRFARVLRTRIGSPMVIAGMKAAGGKVVGYEANGGFLLGFQARGPAGPLPPLFTRDSLLPLIATLVAARGAGLAALVAAEPARFTAADRVQNVATEAGAALVAELERAPAARGALLAGLGAREAAVDRTDGLRITLAGGRILHLRPSGNAPELRIYVEAESRPAADALLEGAIRAVTAALLRP